MTDRARTGLAPASRAPWLAQSGGRCVASGLLGDQRLQRSARSPRTPRRPRPVAGGTQADQPVVQGNRTAAGQRREPQPLHPAQDRGELVQHRLHRGFAAAAPGSRAVRHRRSARRRRHRIAMRPRNGCWRPACARGRPGQLCDSFAHREPVHGGHHGLGITGGPHIEAGHRGRPAGLADTSPACASRSSASRIGVRLTPSQPASSASRNCSPGAKVPSTMASRSRRIDVVAEQLAGRELHSAGTGMQYIASLKTGGRVKRPW